eukprot:209647_1
MLGIPWKPLKVHLLKENIFNYMKINYQDTELVEFEILDKLWCKPKKNRHKDKKTKKVKDKKYEMQKQTSTELEKMDKKEEKEGGQSIAARPTNTETTNGEEVDYNNNFPNAQKIVSVPDNYDGPADAASENYYAAEVLNLKFNPNAKSRFGLASHYMSLSASFTT